MSELILSEDENFLHTITHKRRLANFFKAREDGLSVLKMLLSKLNEIRPELEDHFQRKEEERASHERAKDAAAEQIAAILSSNNLTADQVLPKLANALNENGSADKKSSTKDPSDLSQYKYIYEHDGQIDVWKGGAGRKPKWIVIFQDQGVDIKMFLNPLYKGKV